MMHGQQNVKFVKCSLGQLHECRVLKTGLGYWMTLLVVMLLFHGNDGERRSVMIMFMVIFCFIIGFRSYETCSETIPLPTKFYPLPSGW